MTGCVLHVGAVNNRGYGVVRRGGKTMLAHRVSYMLANPDEDISNRLVLHRCDVRLCIRDSHLFSGTAAMNTFDMISKGRGRWARGEDAGKSKLTWNQVCEIRKRYVPGKGGNLKKLCTKYGVAKATVLDIVKGRTWKGEIK